jgi:hypothetical protein
MKKIINLLLGLSLCLNSYTQTSQLKSFDKEIFKEDFNSKNAPFHINSDKDNYMVIDDGDLFINRTNPSLAQAVFSKNSKSVVYRVQLGIFDELIDVEGIENLTTIHTQAQQIIYIAGKFDNFSSARGYLLEMSKKGFKDAFIVKF